MGSITYFAVKFLIATFTDEIHEVIIASDRISKTKMRAPVQLRYGHQN
ncbi:hypothetical protein [Komarekiella delphini-convector]|nr:hypothetical protein [Komarekiella delphini-convector]